MKNGQKISLLFLNIVCVLALVVVVFPLLLISQYNYPSADDWSYGASGYEVIKNGGGLLAVLKASAETVWHTYRNVEGRFVGIFFATLQPGIWGEQYYVVVAWILIGMIIFSELFLFRGFLCSDKQEQNRWLWIPVIVPALIMQILYCPYPEESFYWYTGSMYYTFSFGLSLIVLVLFFWLATRSYTKGKYVLLASIAGVLAFLVGGMNFGTSLSLFLTLCVVSVLLLIYNRKALKATWFITVLSGVSLLLCVFAPGNTNRINTNFGGETEGALGAIVMSLVRSAINIYSWTNVKVILMLLFLVPFVWKAVKSLNWEFKFPGIFSILTFGLYASQAAPTMYVDGTTGGGRMAAILYYSYYVWMLGNLIYWLGWLCKRQNKLQALANGIQSRFGKMLLPYCALIGAILVACIYFTDLREITSYRAYRNWRQGFAQQYAAEWDARLEILHDDSIKDVEFQFLTVYPDMLLYTDLQDDSGHVWVNHACAEYYHKNSVRIILPENKK